MSPIMSVYTDITDVFYGRLDSRVNSMGIEDSFDEFGEEVYADGKKQILITAYLFGITLGIIECKKNSNRNSEKIVAKIKKDINNSELDYKNEIIKTATDCVNYLCDPILEEHPEGAGTSKELNEMTSLLLGRKLRKGDSEDPLCCSAMIEAIGFEH